VFAVNLVTRSLILLVGIGIAFGIPPFSGLLSPLHEIFGKVVILFGAYRLALLYYRQRQERKQ
jgi:hypothetical protein